MPWSEYGSGYTKKGSSPAKGGGFVRNPKQYEKLRGKGMSKQQAAAISNRSVGKSAFFEDEEVENTTPVSKPKGWRIKGDEIRDERGRFVSLRTDPQVVVENVEKSAFGVVHKGERDKHKGAKIGVLAGVGAAAVMGRGRANRVGGKIGSRAAEHAEWAGNRLGQMKNPHLKTARHGYSLKLKSLGNEIKRSDDTREVWGRSAAATGVGGVTGVGVNASDKRKRY